MTCDICSHRYALSEPVQDRAGQFKRMCHACAVINGKPTAFAEGTQRTKLKPSEFTDNERDNTMRLLELHTAQRDRLAHMLAELLQLFPELRSGLTTAPQQQTLREARALLAECGL